MTFRKRIGRRQDKKRSTDLEIRYQMLYSRISNDALAKSYEHLKVF